MSVTRVRFLSLALACLLGMAALTGCGASRQSKAAAPAPGPLQPAPSSAADDGKTTHYPIAIKDAAGRTVTIPAEPQRIMSLAPSNTELLFALGAGPRVVGRTDFCDYPPEAKQLPSVGGVNPDFEKIVSLKPDLVLVINGSLPVREKLENEVKVPVLVVDPKNLEQMTEGVRNLGIALNAQPAATQLLDQIQAAVSEVQATAAKATSRPKVFYQVWDEPLMTSGNHTFIDDIIRIAGGENVGHEVEGWAEFSAEKLQAANPDMIIGPDRGAADKIIAHKGWEGLQAIKAGKVYALPDQALIVRPGPRLIQGLRWMAKTIHPELFGS